jgi:REP element-mobilizing transposase RayT
MKRRRSKQLGLGARGGGRGGWRAGSGRPPKNEGEHRGHRPRPFLAARFPAHVTLKLTAGAPYLRRGVCFRAVRSALAAGKRKPGFRLVHFTVQGNHLHLICEADDRLRLSRGMQGLAILVAKRLNKKLARKGRLFAERYHARILRSPRQVRNALVYVLNNSRRHDPTISKYWVDPLSSAPWFSGWKRPLRDRTAQREGPPPIVPAETWLLGSGWRKAGGRLGLDEIGRVHHGH